MIKVSDYASRSFANDTQEIERDDTNLALPQVTVHADLFRFLISDLFHPWSSYFYLVHGNSTLSSLIPLPFIYVSARHPVALIEREILDVAKTFRVLETRRVLQAIGSAQSTLELQIFWPSRAATISIILLRTLIIDDSNLNHGHAWYSPFDGWVILRTCIHRLLFRVFKLISQWIYRFEICGFFYPFSVGRISIGIFKHGFYEEIFWNF